jgi:hypothetical protein
MAASLSSAAILEQVSLMRDPSGRSPDMRTLIHAMLDPAPLNVTDAQ